MDANGNKNLRLRRIERKMDFTFGVVAALGTIGFSGGLIAILQTLGAVSSLVSGLAGAASLCIYGYVLHRYDRHAD